MHTRCTTSSSDIIISNLNAVVESIIAELDQIKSSPINFLDADALENLEIDLHAKTTKLADLIAAIKLQETLNSHELEESEKNLIKSYPKKHEKHGAAYCIDTYVGWDICHH